MGYIASHGLARRALRVAVGHGAAMARVIVVPMARAVALAIAYHAKTMARAMATRTVCSAMASRGIAVGCNGMP